MTLILDDIKPLTFAFTDDGIVPNNRLPLVIYRKAIDVGGVDPEAAIERVFGENGWGDMWRNGIFDYQHYHATVHEALGIARGAARVLFGGERGDAIDLLPGDVAILPAGTGHRKLFANHDFRCVGAYPPGAKMQVTLPTPANYRKALLTIPKVPRPDTDPVYGGYGALVRLWR